MERHRTPSRSNAITENYLLGGKDVSLVVTVSVITKRRKGCRINVMLIQPNWINVLSSLHAKAWLVQRLTHLNKSPLRPLPGAVAVGSLSHNAMFLCRSFQLWVRTLLPWKIFFSIQDPCKISGHFWTTAIAVTAKPMVTPFSSFLLVNSQ